MEKISEVFSNFSDFKTKINAYDPDLILDSDSVFYDYFVNRFSKHSFASDSEIVIVAQIFRVFKQFKTVYVKVLKEQEKQIIELIVAKSESISKSSDESLGEADAKFFVSNGGSSKMLPSVLSVIRSFINLPNIYESLDALMFPLFSVVDNSSSSVPRFYKLGDEAIILEALVKGADELIKKEITNYDFKSDIDKYVLAHQNLIKGPKGDTGPAGKSITGPAGPKGPAGPDGLRYFTDAGSRLSFKINAHVYWTIDYSVIAMRFMQRTLYGHVPIHDLEITNKKYIDDAFKQYKGPVSKFLEEDDTTGDIFWKDQNDVKYAYWDLLKEEFNFTFPVFVQDAIAPQNPVSKHQLDTAISNLPVVIDWFIESNDVLTLMYKGHAQIRIQKSNDTIIFMNHVNIENAEIDSQTKEFVDKQQPVNIDTYEKVLLPKLEQERTHQIDERINWHELFSIHLEPDKKTRLWPIIIKNNIKLEYDIRLKIIKLSKTTRESFIYDKNKKKIELFLYFGFVSGTRQLNQTELWLNNTRTSNTSINTWIGQHNNNAYASSKNYLLNENIDLSQQPDLSLTFEISTKSINPLFQDYSFIVFGDNQKLNVYNTYRVWGNGIIDDFNHSTNNTFWKLKLGDLAKTPPLHIGLKILEQVHH